MTRLDVAMYTAFLCTMTVMLIDTFANAPFVGAAMDAQTALIGISFLTTAANAISVIRGRRNP